MNTSFVEVPVTSLPAVASSYSSAVDVPTVPTVNNKQSIATIHLGQAVIDLYDNTSPETLKMFLEVIAHA